MKQNVQFTGPSKVPHWESYLWFGGRISNGWAFMYVQWMPQYNCHWVDHYTQYEFGQLMGGN